MPVFYSLPFFFLYSSLPSFFSLVCFSFACCSFLLFQTWLKYSVHVLKRVWFSYFRFVTGMFLFGSVPGSAVCDTVIQRRKLKYSSRLLPVKFGFLSHVMAYTMFMYWSIRSCICFPSASLFSRPGFSAKKNGQRIQALSCIDIGCS
jgi:hypothetical protein